jgi:hypothetical protein
VQRAPGIPHALKGGESEMHDSGATRREIVKSYLELEQRHCERSEAIHSFFLPRYGLLRFARNDGSTPELPLAV